MRRRLSSALLLGLTVLAALCLASAAHAQACPDGARGHALPGPGPQANGYCAPFRCQTDADCGGALHCVPVPMCIGQLEGHPGTETAWHQCDAHDACSTGEHCEHARVCSSAAAPRAPTPPPPAPPAPPHHRAPQAGSKPSGSAPPRR